MHSFNIKSMLKGERTETKHKQINVFVQIYKSRQRMAVALSLQSYLGCNQAATHPLTHSDKTSSFTGRRHQICSPSARLIVQLCNTPIMSHARQRKTDISCTHSARLAYGCLLSQPPHLLHLSFHSPFFLPA